MNIAQITAYLETIENDAARHDAQQFEARAEVIDFIGFQLMEAIDELLQQSPTSIALLLLRERAATLQAMLEAIDTQLFQDLQAGIRASAYTGNAFKTLIDTYVDGDTDMEYADGIGYDNLDVFINGLSLSQVMPEQTRELEPEMVFYQKTPARMVVELVERVGFTQEDVFVDIGSGLGQVAVLVNLLAGIAVTGIEFEPAFCEYARAYAGGLNLKNVSFVNVDARQADYSSGTVFFMFTPFRGTILEQVLAMLQQEALHRKIKIITYGPCTHTVASLNWLQGTLTACEDVYKLYIFNSL